MHAVTELKEKTVQGPYFETLKFFSAINQAAKQKTNKDIKIE